MNRDRLSQIVSDINKTKREMKASHLSKKLRVKENKLSPLPRNTAH